MTFLFLRGDTRNIDILCWANNSKPSPNGRFNYYGIYFLIHINYCVLYVFS